VVVDAEFQNIFSVANKLSFLEWPKWPFPEFEAEPDYLAQVRKAMTRVFYLNGPSRGF